MKKALIAAALGAAIVAPAQAVVIVEGGASQTPDLVTSATFGTTFNGGSLVDSGSFSQTTGTFSASVGYAVFLNGLGTYDFYYQVARLGAGNGTPGNNNSTIKRITPANFTGFTTDVYRANFDVDGAGSAFIAPNNPGSFTTTASVDEGIVEFAFGSNNLTGTDVSAVYIVRTNATAYMRGGSFGVIDGTAFSSPAFMPAAVPEPATWGMMLLGFGLIGSQIRRRRGVAVAAA